MPLRSTMAAAFTIGTMSGSTFVAVEPIPRHLVDPPMLHSCVPHPQLVRSLGNAKVGARGLGRSTAADTCCEFDTRHVRQGSGGLRRLDHRAGRLHAGPSPRPARRRPSCRRRCSRPRPRRAGARPRRATARPAAIASLASTVHRSGVISAKPPATNRRSVTWPPSMDARSCRRAAARSSARARGSTPISPSEAGITTMSTGFDSSSFSGLTISSAMGIVLVRFPACAAQAVGLHAPRPSATASSIVPTM